MPETKAAAPAEPRPRKVLVVDDAAGDLKSALEQAGFEVVTRPMAVGTTAAILRERPDVVVVDAGMPLLSLEDVITALRKRPALRHTVVLIHSSMPRGELAELARQTGANDWLEKGDPAALVKLVLDWTAARRKASGVREIGLLPELLLACAPEVADRLRPSLDTHFTVSATDSGAEALRRICSSRPPDFAVVGTSLADLDHDRMSRCAHDLDARWRRRLIVLEEVPTEPSEADAVAPDELLARLLELSR